MNAGMEVNRLRMEVTCLMGLELSSLMDTRLSRMLHGWPERDGIVHLVQQGK